MPKMYALYSLACLLPRSASQAFINRFSRQASVSLAWGMRWAVRLRLHDPKGLEDETWRPAG